MSAIGERALESLGDQLHRANLPIFVGRWNSEGSPVLELGTFERVTSGMQATARSVTARVEPRASVRFVRHNPRRLRAIRSLEAFIAKTGQGALVLDTTQALRRSESIVLLSAAIRERLAGCVRGLYFQSERRTLFVIIDRKLASLANSDARSRIGAQIIEAELAWRRAATQVLDIAIRIGYDLPSGINVVAVDRATVRFTFAQMVQRPLGGSIVAAIVGSIAGTAVALPASAADLIVEQSPGVVTQDAAAEPAVDQPNFSVEALGGVARDPVMFDHLWAGLSAKGTIPLGERFGAQLDLGVASDQYYGAGLHLFARDPAMGLVGIVGSAESKYGVTMNRVGAEVEYYLNDKFTVGARVGFQGGTAPNGAFGQLDVKFYPDPNLALTAKAELQPSFAVGSLGVEWRPAADSLPGLSVSADGSLTSTGDYRAMFGLHFQIGGGGSTLIDRDRRSDPDSAIFNQIDARSAVPKAYAGPPPG